jgi:hypothetical protein
MMQRVVRGDDFPRSLYVGDMVTSSKQAMTWIMTDFGLGLY